MAEDYYLGVDVGTGSARVCIIDQAGDIRGLASENIGLWQPQVGFYEQSTTDIWRCICNSAKKALAEAAIDPSAVKGIGIDATCSLAIFTRDTDEPVSVTGPKFNENDHNVILWLDHRPEEETKKINATDHNLLRYVGGQMSIEMEMPKALWLKKNMPKELFDRLMFFDLADALTHIATGNLNRSFNSVVCKQGYVPVGVDGSVKGWQEDFLKAIGLEELCEDNFKRLGGVNGVNGQYLHAGELCGKLSEKAAKEMGLVPGIPVGSGVIDAYAGWIGTVGAKVDIDDGGKPSSDVSQAFGRLAAVAGTSTCHIVMSEKPVFVPGVWGPYRDAMVPDYWLAEGGQSATGELLRHVLETHPAYAEAKKDADAVKQNIYDYLNAHLHQKQKDLKAPTVSYLGKHFFFYGDFFGNRSPIADPKMTGAIVGLTSDKSVDALATMYYGAMEFIALQTHQIIEAMNSRGHQITSIFMSGSLCQNDILMHLMATACGVPVLIPKYVHAAVVVGAAMLGAKAASAGADGRSDDLWTIMDRMSKPGTTIHPGTNEHEKKLLQTKYKVFLELCESQRRFRKEVDDAVAGWQ